MTLYDIPALIALFVVVYILSSIVAYAIHCWQEERELRQMNEYNDPKRTSCLKHEVERLKASWKHK